MGASINFDDLVQRDRKYGIRLAVTDGMASPI